MQRITITIDDELADEIDKLVRQHGYQNRSEALRDLVRAGMVETQHHAYKAAECLAGVIYVYDQRQREMPKRLANAYQQHHDLAVATVRIALDHNTCMDVAVLKGRTADVKSLAEQIIAERGVRHGRVIIIPAQIETVRHGHGRRQPHTHQHIRVR